MKNISNDQLTHINNLLFRASLALVFFILLLLFRLWFLQIFKGSYYARISENNRVRKIDLPAQRGMIYDRHNKLVLGNKRMYDLVYIPQYVENKEKTLKAVSLLLHTSYDVLDKNLKRHRGQAKFIPITIKQNLSVHERSLIESYKNLIPGVDIKNVPKRQYTPDIPVHLLGYLSEYRHSKSDSKQQNDLYTYLPGDLSGKQGIELVWEKYLRGKRGYRYIQVDALGRESKTQVSDVERSLPEVKATPGLNLFLTIDWDLQKASQKAFQGKNGAIIALNPQNGQILSLVSSPSYNPNIFQEGLTIDHWQALIDDPFKPFFDKTTGGLFSPGSLFKPLIALAALEEGLINLRSKHDCRGKLKLSTNTFHCHKRWGHGKVTLNEAMLYSCDVFFYHLGLELGMDRIEKYAKDFYLGQKLGLRLNKEYAGLIPSTKWKKQKHNSSVTIGDLANTAIGQGALLFTPLQIASLYATMANTGYVWRPYVVDHLSSPDGEVVIQNRPELIHRVGLVKKHNLKIMKKILYNSVETFKSTGYKAKIENIPVAGKTGSVQVVSLKKNRNRKSVVSMKWQEHAMFAGFSPIDKPEIVIVVVSENDPSGGGGSQSAPIAKAILEAFWRSKKGNSLKSSQPSV